MTVEHFQVSFVRAAGAAANSGKPAIEPEFDRYFVAF
jgi:hypothetical protein